VDQSVPSPALEGFLLTCSVLIATYNRPALLRGALDALVNRTLEKPEEIVIVNGGGSDADTVVQEFSERSNICFRLVRVVNKNLAASRNIGLPLCSGDIVAMTDDDGEVYPDWVTRMKEVHAQHPEAGAVGGAVISAGGGADFLSRLAEVTTFPSPQTPRYVRTLPGVNISYKRRVIQQLGSQDEGLFRGEDVDYNWRLKLLGYEIYYDPNIRVTHHHRPRFSQHLNQHYMYGRAYYLVRRKWPEMYCVYPHRIGRIRDVLKAGYCVLAVLVQPLQMSASFKVWKHRMIAFPSLVLTQLAWKGGMLCQKFKTS